jgi:hypothetical protein
LGGAAREQLLDAVGQVVPPFLFGWRER